MLRDAETKAERRGQYTELSHDALLREQQKTQSGAGRRQASEK